MAKLYSVGIGPGEAELITVKALRVLRSCPVLVFPGSSRESCYAYPIAKQILPELDEKELLFCDFPMTRDLTVLAAAHAAIFEQLRGFLDAGRDVALLTIGDPGIYATTEYIDALARDAGYDCEIIPGVPSFCASAARLGLPLVSRSQSLQIIPGSYGEDDPSACTGGTRVFMKSGKKLHELIAALAEENRTAPMDIAAVSHCGLPGEAVYQGWDEVLAMPADAYLVTLIVKAL